MTTRTKLAVGTRVYNGGDMANQDHFGTITKVIESPKWGDSYEITPDAGGEREKPYNVPSAVFSPRYLGHGGTRFVTEEAYREYRTERIAAMEKEHAEIMARRKLTAYRVHLSDGTSYVTSMAAGVTLDEARDYFMGQPQEQADERTILTVVNVEPA